ncbi:XRE family transcriptional regulator [Micromonospora zingiberis]|nr:XRE family transcriptional regulator [Micromonospora zingiberis]
MSPPSPDDAATSAEFVAALRALREWSGLTYRQIAGNAAAAGEVLPSSTIAAALGRTTLPRQQVVAAFARACGLDGATTARWVAARNRIAAGSVGPEPTASPIRAEATGAASSTEPSSTESETVPRTRPVDPAAPANRRWLLVAAITVVATLVIALTAALIWDREQESGVPTNTTHPIDGWYLVRPAHIDDRSLCLGEGRERNGRTDRPLAVQRPCDKVSPDTYLREVGADVYELQWHHPTEGAGCLTVDDAFTGDGALLAPSDCVGASHQRYLLDPVDDSTGNNYRLRPVHSGLCIGLLGGPAEVNIGAEVVQTPCSGTDDQKFLISPTQKANRTS